MKEQIIKIMWFVLSLVTRTPLLLVWIIVVVWLSSSISPFFFILIILTGLAMGKLDEHPEYGTEEGLAQRRYKERTKQAYKKLDDRND